MAGIIGALAAYPGASSATVQLHNQSIYKSNYATATVSYQINTNGNVVANPDGTLEAWLTGTGASASNYEVMATQTSGSTISGTFGTWLNCSASNMWSISNSATDNSVLTGVFTVQIRDVATHTGQASASITLSAESDNRGGGGGGILP